VVEWLFDTGVPAVCEEVSKLVQRFVEPMNADAAGATVRDAIQIHPTLGEAAPSQQIGIPPAVVRVGS
jgi:hypothetical protein